MRYLYLELKEGERVVRRQPTTIASEVKDRRMMERFQRKGQQIHFVVSSAEEKVIN